MTDYNFGEQLHKDTKQYGISGKDEFFGFQEGDNKLRILSPAAVVAQHFLGKDKKPAVCFGEEEGCPHHGEQAPKANIKWLVWVWDHHDNGIKLAKLPYTVMQAIAELQKSDEYKFSSLPMPYSINIKTKGAGTKEVEYNVIPARENTPVSDEIMEEYGTKKDPEEIVEAYKSKARGDTLGEDINAEEIPF